MERLNTIFQHVFGRISWERPAWLKGLNKYHLMMLVSIVVVYVLYAQLPQPERVKALVTPPRETILGEQLIPEPLTIDFEASVAPLEMLGKTSESGIRMEPAIAGKWHWESDNRLTFMPERDWPAGQKYQIRFDKELFAAPLATYRYEFSTMPLSVEVEALRFYQDLKDPQIRKMVATLQFNFPVDADSLKKHVRLVMPGLKILSEQQFSTLVTFDKHQRTAYVESEPITLPTQSRPMHLIVERGLQASFGPSATQKRVVRKEVVPSLDRLLRIVRVDADIAYENEQPYQVLNVETSVGVSGEELAKFLRIYAFAKRPKYIAQDKEKPVPFQILEEPNPHLHRLKFSVAPNSFLHISVQAGLPGFGGAHLSQNFSEGLYVADYPHEIKFLHTGSLMALSGEKKISVAVRNIPDVKFSIGQVFEHHIAHLVTKTYGDFQSPRFKHGFKREDMAQIFTEMRQFDSFADLDYTHLDLGQYSNGLGLFLIKAEEWDTQYNIPGNAKSERLILITDMDMIVKDNDDGTHDLFVHGIEKGAPVVGAEVSLLGRNGLPIFSAVSDTEGHVSIPSVQDFKEERQPAVYLVRYGADLSFMPYHRSDRVLNYSRYDVGGSVAFPRIN